MKRANKGHGKQNDYGTDNNEGVSITTKISFSSPEIKNFINSKKANNALLDENRNKITINHSIGLEYFLKDVYNFSNILDSKIIKNTYDLDIFICLMKDVLNYIIEVKDEILSLKKVELFNFRDNFMLIEKKIKELPYDNSFLEKIWNTSKLRRKDNVTKKLNDLYDDFEDVYYLVIKPSRKKISRRLNVSQISDDLKTDNLLENDSIFFKVVNDIKAMCNYILSKDTVLNDLNIEEKDEIIININSVVELIDNILKDSISDQYTNWERRAQLTIISQDGNISLLKAKEQIEKQKNNKPLLTSNINKEKEIGGVTHELLNEVDILSNLYEISNNIPSYIIDKSSIEVEQLWVKNIELFNTFIKNIRAILNPFSDFKKMSNNILAGLKEKMSLILIKIEEIKNSTNNNYIFVRLKLLLNKGISKKILEEARI